MLEGEISGSDAKIESADKATKIKNEPDVPCYGLRREGLLTGSQNVITERTKDLVVIDVPWSKSSIFPVKQTRRKLYSPPGIRISMTVD